MTTRLLDLASPTAGRRPGITSVCSAHPLVIAAALAQGRDDGTDVLIEATCNQVNQEGGYTGMTPADFRRFVEEIADRVGFDRARLILGGDHLGPNPWKALPAEEALARAGAMVAAYVEAGFTKIHLDTSMGCRGEPEALPDAVTAGRAARLAAISEAAGPEGSEKPVYIIGTEVPIPGGAFEALDHLAVTRPEAALETVAVHRAAFADAGVAGAFERTLGVVVQPGVEFGNENVVVYDRPAAGALSAALDRMPGLVFEAHSTDYQPAEALAALVQDGFAILKVGPGLTFALREALYGLDRIAAVMDGLAEDDTLAAAMERLMVAEPGHWAKYYPGDASAQRIQRHYSYSDRIRYYWPHRTASGAVERLLSRLAGRHIPETLVSQYLGPFYPAVAAGTLAARPDALLRAAVQRALAPYRAACGIGS